jgi:hypothetical protein
VDQVLQRGWPEELVGVVWAWGTVQGHVVHAKREVGFGCWHRWAAARSEVDGVYEPERDPRWILRV